MNPPGKHTDDKASRMELSACPVPAKTSETKKPLISVERGGIMVAVQGIRPFFTTNVIYLKTLMILSIACAYTPQMCTKMCAQSVRNVYVS